jgi:hypothetical protein
VRSSVVIITGGCVGSQLSAWTLLAERMQIVDPYPVKITRESVLCECSSEEFMRVF